MGGFHGTVGNQTNQEGETFWSGMLWGVWFGFVRMKARAAKVNEIAKELDLHLVPLGHELVGIHVWSEVNVLADALSRIGNHTTVPGGLRHVRREISCASFLAGLR